MPIKFSISNSIRRDLKVSPSFLIRLFLIATNKIHKVVNQFDTGLYACLTIKLNLKVNTDFLFVTKLTPVNDERLIARSVRDSKVNVEFYRDCIWSR